jgi:hypothetical protein
MSAEFAHKENNYEMPMVPFFSLDMARELGDLAAGQRQLEAGQSRLESRIDVLEAKTDKMGYTLNRLDERTKSMQNQIMVIGGGTFVAVLAGIVLQLFKQ